MTTPATPTPAPAPASTPADPVAEFRGQLAQYQRDLETLRADHNAVKAENAALKEQVGASQQRAAAAERTARLATYEKTLKEFGEFHQIDVPKQVEYTKEHTPDQFEKHMAMLATIAPMAPVGGRVPVAYVRDGAEGNPAGSYYPGKQMSEDQWARVFQYQREHPNCDVEVAVREALKA